jgi:hypothetical protein
MCLLLVAFDSHTDYKLIVAANRDEFHERPADPAAYWRDYPDILGGRDRQGGGSWLAVNRRGAFAAITNVRIPGGLATPRSRGLIVNDYLTGSDGPRDFGVWSITFCPAAICQKPGMSSTILPDHPGFLRHLHVRVQSHRQHENVCD